jgi:ribosome-associated protein
MLTVNERITIPEAELHWSYSRAGGPGGQNVNKVASKATLRWPMHASSAVTAVVKSRLGKAHPSLVTTDGEVLITSQEYRDQERNRERCLEKLRDILLAAATPPKPRFKTKPTKASQRRRLDDKKQQATKKARRADPGE